jgi:hypothetical protein
MYNDAITGTKTKREPNGESPSVILMHCMGVLRRDSLPLFNQNYFIMRTNDERANCTPMAISAEAIIESITSSDDPVNLRKHLRTLMDAYFLLPDEDMDHPKDQVYCTFQTLDQALQMIKSRESLSKERKVA